MITQPLQNSLQEIGNWLDFKKVPQRKRDAYKDAIETLADAISNGSMSISEDNHITYKLNFEVGGVSELKFKPRLTVSDVKAKTSTLKTSDAEGRLLAYVSALTEVSVGELSKLDTEDFSICQSIAVFFL